MTVRAKTAGAVGGVLLLLIAARTSFAADQEAILQQITTLNKTAITAYSDGDFEKSKKQLLQAVAVAKKDPELQTHPLMARTFLHLGVVYVDGIEDRSAGIKYFVKALKIRPDIEVSQALATKTVKSAFEEARGESGEEGTAVAKEAPSKEEGGTEMATKKESSTTETPAVSDDTAAEEKPAAKMTAAEKKKAAEEAKRLAAEEKRTAAAEKKKEAEEAKHNAAEEKRAAAEEKKKAAEEAKQAALEEKRAAKEAKEKDRQAQSEKDKLAKELAAAQGSEAKERAAKEKLQSEKADKEKQLADAKAALDQLQKDTKEKEKQAQAEKEKLAKELAQLKESEAKERAAKEKLQAEKADKEKQLAEVKASLQQLQKEKADKEKQLADAAVREKKEREIKEKLEKEKQLAEAREKERKEKLEKERLDREKLAAGPDIPSHIPEPLYCAVPDEAQAGSELFVHCVPRDSKAKVVALYYRQSGGVHYNSLTMEPSKKGWYMAVIPAEKVSGKLLQYYAEARDGRGSLAGATGKPTSPNILTLRTGVASAPKVKTAGRAAPRSR